MARVKFAGRRVTRSWLLALTAVAVMAGSGMGITQLQHRAAERDQLRVMLTQMKCAAWQQSALRSRALMAHGVTAEIARGRADSDATADAVGEEFARRATWSAQARAVQSAFGRYDAAITREFELLGAGDLLAAQRVDEWQATPAFQGLITTLDAAEAHYRAMATRASDSARTGTILILSLAALLIIGLAWQSQRFQARAFRRAAHQASHDALTGLPNRTLLQSKATEAIAGGGPVGLLLIDLDRFKEVNDTLGHHYGDQLLIQAAARMRDVLGVDEMVARLGGDEFAVLLPGVADAAAIAAAGARLQEALRAPFTLDGLNLTVAGSIGAALCPQHGTTADELLKKADIAMYAAKSRRTGYALFDQSQDSTDPRKLTLASDLRRGIDENELVLWYQPKVDAQTGSVLGVEALVRWQHPEHGLIPPNEFIPLAEHTGLITPLTTFVLDDALRQCRSWINGGHGLTVAVNVSTHRLLDLSFPDEVADRLRHWEVPARLLTIEITESAIMADPDRALQVVERLHAIGVHLSIDDFGTGYSSMAYLKTLPVHELKIDRSFVSCMTTSERDAVIVRSTVELGRNLGLKVVAEGVEDIDTWQQLDDVGCDTIQGYYVSKPMPGGSFEQWLGKRAKLVAA